MVQPPNRDVSVERVDSGRFEGLTLWVGFERKSIDARYPYSTGKWASVPFDLASARRLHEELDKILGDCPK